MGNRLGVGKPSPCRTSHPGQLSVAIPSWVGAMSISDSWGVNRHTTWCTSPCPWSRGVLTGVWLRTSQRSAIEACPRRCAIQIYVYFTLHSIFLSKQMYICITYVPRGSEHSPGHTPPDLYPPDIPPLGQFPSLWYGVGHSPFLLPCHLPPPSANPQYKAIYC